MTEPKTKVARPSARGKKIVRRGALAPPSAIRSAEALEEAFSLLRAADPELVDRLVAVAGPPPLRARAAGLPGLAWIVVSQQVSTASAEAIHRRVIARFPDLNAGALLAASDEDLAACGLSRPKQRTLRAVAQAAIDGALDFDALEGMSADEAHAALVAIKGVGPWTADIYLLFCLGHPDAWPAGDLALQEAARMALRLRARPDPPRLTKIAARWRPVRGVAARLLWAWYGAVKKGFPTLNP